MFDLNNGRIKNDDLSQEEQYGQTQARLFNSKNRKSNSEKRSK